MNFCFVLIVVANTQSCITGLPSLAELQSLAVRCDFNSSACLSDNNDGRTYIFPNLTFTCSGFITMWSAAGLAHTSYYGTDPEIVIWRKTSEEINYTIRDTISMLSCNSGIITRDSIAHSIYHCRLDDEVQVEPGDLLGLQMPVFMDNYDQFNLYFDRKSNNLPTACSRKGSITRFQLPQICPRKGLPLISLEVQTESK